MNYCPICGQRVDLMRPFQCPGCSEWQWSNAKPAAGVLLEHNGKVLLIRRAFDPWCGYWDVPGGFCDGLEHPEEAAVREAQEELGLNVELCGLLGMWMDTYGTHEHADFILNIYYLARWEGDEAPEFVLDLAEASEGKWFGPDELPEDMGFPNHQPAIVATWAQVMSGERELTPLPERSPKPTA